jgi:hypothetical protein
MDNAQETSNQEAKTETPATEKPVEQAQSDKLQDWIKTAKSDSSYVDSDVVALAELLSEKLSSSDKPLKDILARIEALEMAGKLPGGTADAVAAEAEEDSEDDESEEEDEEEDEEEEEEDDEEDDDEQSERVDREALIAAYPIAREYLDAMLEAGAAEVSALYPELEHGSDEWISKFDEVWPSVVAAFEEAVRERDSVKAEPKAAPRYPSKKPEMSTGFGPQTRGQDKKLQDMSLEELQRSLIS